MNKTSKKEWRLTLWCVEKFASTTHQEGLETNFYDLIKPLPNPLFIHDMTGKLTAETDSALASPDENNGKKKDSPVSGAV